MPAGPKGRWRARSVWHWPARGDYPEGVVVDPWVGDGTARAATSDIVRALGLYKLACLIEGGLVLGAWLAGHFSLLM